MKKNFETPEVGRRYENRVGQVVKIVKNDEHDTYPFVGDDGESYTPEGQFKSWQSGKFDLIKLLPKQPTTRLAELDAELTKLKAKRAELKAKRAELNKKIEELKKNTQTLYCEAFLWNAENRILLDISRTEKERELKIEESAKNETHPTITTFDLPFRKVNGKWEVAFEIVLK